MSVGHAKSEDTSDDQVFLAHLFVIACHHNHSSVGVEVFLNLQESFLDSVLELIQVFVKQFVDHQTMLVRFSSFRFQQMLFIQQGGSELRAALAFHLSPSRECDGRNSKEVFCNWGDQNVLGSHTVQFC